jgi:putative heme-binding domain-containing protein
VDGPSAEVFRISPDEPWRVIRTQWRLAGLVPGPVEGGGRPSGYFTGATGITLYRGDAFPEEYHDNAFVADCGSNLIHRKRIVPDESAVRLVARRPDDEQKTEFLASTDIWFRPVQMANAPDGALYIADMYREVIEHPWSLPAPIKALLDLNSGNDRGRIYRIVPERFKQPKPVRLGSASLKQLVDSLESRNGWHRDTAARLLYQRQDQAAVPMLQFLLEHSSSAAARLHALYALDGMTSLRFSDIVSALGDPDGAVRIHALRILEKRFAPEAARSDSLILPLGNLSRDADPFVAYQLAFTLGDVAVPNRAMILTEILQRHPRDPWVEAAVLSSLNSGAGELVLQLMLKAPSATGSDMQRVLVEAAGIIGAQIDSRVVTNVFESAFKNPNRKVAFSVVAALEAGLQQSGKGLARTVPQKSLDALVTEARSRAADRGLPEAERESAVHLLGIIGDSGVRDLALTLIGAGEAEAIQSAAVRALARGSSAGFANLVLERWSKLPPQVRTDAILSLLTRSEWTRDLLAAIERGEVARSGLSAGQLQSLRTSRDATTRQLVVNLFGEQSNAGRQEVVNAYYPALKLPGDANRGKAIYLERCASCHRSAGQGQVLGPDFATVKSSGKEMLLVNILDPNRQVAPSYLDYAVETKDGRMLNGILAAESAVAITLRGPNGVETVLPRPEVSRLESLGRSLMPDGLEAGLKPGQLADLLEYIVASKE